MHKLQDIIVIVLFTTLANVDGQEEMEYFAQCQEKYLQPSRKNIEKVCRLRVGTEEKPG